MSEDTHHIPLLLFLTYMGCKSTGRRLCLHSISLSKIFTLQVGATLFTNLTHPRKEQKAWRNWPASTCAQVKLSTQIPDHKEQSASEASWILSSSVMTLRPCCLGDCCNVLQSVLELHVCCCWPHWREGQGQEASEEPILCDILI